MKIAVVADIHGNLEAFSAVRAAIGKKGADAVVCLGDIVGYGADPVACLELLGELEPSAVVRGNHDSAACGLAALADFTDHARAAIEWTAGLLGRPQLDYLRALPLVSETAGAVLVHAALDQPGNWRYLLSPEETLPSFSLLSNRACFFGHTHRAIAYRREPRGAVKAVRGSLILDKGTKYMINPGSVGQPRDRDPRSSFAVYDSDSARVEMVRVDYDRRKAAAKIIAAGLPSFLAERLFSGR